MKRRSISRSSSPDPLKMRKTSSSEEIVKEEEQQQQEQQEQQYDQSYASHSSDESSASASNSNDVDSKQTSANVDSSSSSSAAAAAASEPFNYRSTYESYYHQCAASEQEVTHRYLVEIDRVGQVIGKHGATIEVLRRLTNCRLSIDKVPPTVPGDRVLTITGKPAMIALCIDLLAQIFLDHQKKNPQTDRTEVNFLTHQFKSGAVIGKGGQTSTQIRQEFDILLMVTKDCYASSTEKKITVVGTASNLGRCYYDIMNRVQKFILRDGTPMILYKPGTITAGPIFPPSPFQLSSSSTTTAAAPPQFAHFPRPDLSSSSSGDNKLERKVYIPKQCAGHVLGVRGATIREMARQSQCHIELCDPENNNPELKMVVMHGSEAALNYCQMLLSSKLDSYAGPSVGGSSAAASAATAARGNPYASSSSSVAYAAPANNPYATYPPQSSASAYPAYPASAYPAYSR